MRVPVELETAVREAARAVLGDGVFATGALTRAIVDRSARYTSERDRLAKPRDPDGDLAARAAFFTIADAMKIALPIDELARRDALPSIANANGEVARREAGASAGPDRGASASLQASATSIDPDHLGALRVLDVGAGCGAMTLGLIAALDRMHVEVALDVTAIDRDARALAIAARAIAAFARSRRVSVATRVGDATRAEQAAGYDLVVMGTVLNELAPDAALALVERSFAMLSPTGALIVVEPALRDTSRGLHAIRDAMIARGAHVFAPCTRRCVPCTALANPDDWCHEDRALDLPPVTRELARLTHLRDSGMKFAYLVLRREPLDLVAAGPAAWRAVSAPFVEKGKRELTGCSERGRVMLRLLKRNRTADNREFERADRGDVLVIDDAPGEQRLEIAGPVHVHSE